MAVSVACKSVHFLSTLSCEEKTQLCVSRASKKGRIALLGRTFGTWKLCEGHRGMGAKASSHEVRAEAVASPTTSNRHATFEKDDVQIMGDQVGNVLFLPVPGAEPQRERIKQNIKVTVVGVGNVGMAIGQTMLTNGILDELALVDVQEDKLRGEMLDLQHGAAFLPRTRIHASSDYKVTAGSDLCIVTAGARQRDGESRLSLVGRNVSLLKKIVPQLVKYSPETVLLVVSNPVDILTWAAWKISGLPSNRVIGSGTNLDSSRFRFLIADSLNLNAQNVHAYILGEHGDSSVPLWSSVTVGGVPVIDFLRSQGVEPSEDALRFLHRQVVEGAYEVIKLKGYTSWAIGYSASALANYILRNQRRVQPVSVLAQGFHGIEQEVFLSLPALLGREGVASVINSPLNEEETEQLQKSAATLWDIQKELDLP